MRTVLQHLEQSERRNVDLLGSIDDGRIRGRHALTHSSLHLAQHLLKVLHSSYLSLRLIPTILLSQQLVMVLISLPLCLFGFGAQISAPQPLQQSVCWR
jgi:hypothetical protein